jgi:polysaccharide export outer membrane protein
VVRRGLAITIAFVAWCVTAVAQQPPPTQQQQQQQNNPPAPAAEKVEAPKVPSTVSADTTGLPIDPRTYVIGPQDILNIRVFHDADFSGAKGVRPDGKITMPLIGDVQAAGLTPQRLADQLKEMISEYIKQPDVVVEVIQVNSKSYSVTGAVGRPGRYPLVLPKTVFDAINDAAGFRDFFANRKDIVIMRVDGKTRLHFNYDEWVKKGNADKKNQNVLIENGDTILVK